MLQADKAELELLERRLQLAGCPYRAIRENDPPYNGELLAIGICPAQKKEIKKYVSSFPLLR